MDRARLFRRSQDQCPDSWAREQHGLRALASFTDADLSFVPPPTYVPDFCDPAELDSPVPRKLQLNSGAFQDLRLVGGLDISTGTDGNTAVASLVVVSFPELQLVDVAFKEIYIKEPYIPSYLAMRESQPLIDLIGAYRDSHPPNALPQVFLVDGNGRLHDREAGLATAVGVLANVPTIGIAKEYYPLPVPPNAQSTDELHFRSTQKGFRLICNQHLKTRGDWLGIIDPKGTRIIAAAILASMDANSTRPIYVSSGHRVSLGTGLQVAVACTQTGRLPEPIRQADKTSRAHIKMQEGNH